MRTVSETAGFEVSPTGGALGAEIIGVDLRQPMTKQQALELRGLLYQHQLLVFRNQEITPEDQIRFTKYFGSLDPGPAKMIEGTHLPGYPDILYLSNEPSSPTELYGSGWHSDGLSVFRIPQDVTVLHCIACPENAGNTLFANQYQAFEAMSKTLQNLLKKLYWRLPDDPTLVQPIVRIHPKTKRHHLYCSLIATHICAMKAEESRFIFDLVSTYQKHQDCIFRHVWRKHDVLVWENRATLHQRAEAVDFASYGLRAMHRTTTKGNIAAQERSLDEFCPT